MMCHHYKCNIEFLTCDLNEFPSVLAIEAKIIQNVFLSKKIVVVWCKCIHASSINTTLGEHKVEGIIYNKQTIIIIIPRGVILTRGLISPCHSDSYLNLVNAMLLITTLQLSPRGYVCRQ